MITIGIDEVGRGSLAGTVVCCAYIQKNKKVKEVTDSKKLSASKRKSLESNIIENGHHFIYEYDEKIINKINILNSTMLCMQKCLISIINNHIENYKNIKIYVDGTHSPFKECFCNNLNIMYDYLSEHEKMLYNYLKTNNNKIIECVVKGDSKIYEIGCASILAKEYRDKQMIALHDLFPLYEWNKNMGYGTKNHINAIKKYGFTLIHRMQFISKFI